MDFLSIVQDQVVNLAPMGVEEGGPSALYPRLEGWLAACDLYNIPQHSRPGIVEAARLLFAGIHDRTNVSGLHQMPVEELLEPGAEELDG
jgi:hypothetical protein